MLSTFTVMKNKQYLFLALLLLSCKQLFAQGEATLGLRGVIPTGEFRYKSDAWGAGASLGVLANIGHDKSWIYLGGELSYMIYGMSDRRFSQNIAGFWRNYQLETNNNMLMGHIVARIKPHHEGNIFPYIDGLFGFNYIYTNTTLKDVTNYGNNNNNTNSQTRNEIDDWAMSYGGAVGVQFGSGNLKFDVKCYYLFGTKARYYDSSSISYTSTGSGVRVAFAEPVYSATNVIIPQIGATFRF